jgi:hypothetical protein
MPEDQIDPSLVSNDPAAEAPIAPASPVDIPDDWASLHWKQVVVLAKQIAPSDVEISFDDAKRIISDEIALRAAPEDSDGLVAVTKNGETLRVNPATVEAHKKAGWALA